jgi:hypothetical protein
MGPKGTARDVRKFLREPALLKKFSNLDGAYDFVRVLDSETELLMNTLPDGNRERKGVVVGTWGPRWGVARKCLNIFLYECLNSRWLCEANPGLKKLEPWLEVPLDSYVGCALHEAGGAQTPAWNTVIDLEKKDSEAYQAFAASLAETKGIHRIHLDLDFYNERSDD